MSRRVSLPAADDLFRRTTEEQARYDDAGIRAVPDAPPRRTPADDGAGPRPRRASRADGCGTTRR